MLKQLRSLKSKYSLSQEIPCLLSKTFRCALSTVISSFFKISLGLPLAILPQGFSTRFLGSSYLFPCVQHAYLHVYIVSLLRSPHQYTTYTEWRNITYNISHASKLTVEFGLPFYSFCKKDTVAGQLVLLLCATLLTLRVTLKQTPAHQNLFSPFSLVTHQKAQLFLLPSPILSHRSSRYYLLFFIRDSCCLSCFARLSEDERIYKRNEVERWTRMSYELLKVEMSLFYTAYILLYLRDSNNSLQP